ncbi:MAG: serine hydrolase [Williamsia sp.]|nr:serine hydrolase [Williamsia sp.]
MHYIIQWTSPHFRKKICSTCLLVFLFCFSCIYAQTADDDDLTKSADSLLSAAFPLHEPGVSILIARKGNVVYRKAFGAANIELGVPMKPDGVFRIGSVTKQFTAIGILQLVEQGKLSLQDSIQKYIPDFPSKGYTITVEHLLTHTSGIPDYSNADTTHHPDVERHDFTPKQLIKSFDYMPLQFKPGTKYNYSNSGYVLLAYIIQQVAGDYHRYMKEHVIGRAGLQHTLFAHEHTIVPNRVEGYTRDKGFFENCEYQTASLAFGCGDLLSTTSDLYQWNNALLSYKLVSKEGLHRAFTPYKLNNGTYTNYGYGWFVDSFGAKRVHHEGQVSGFTAFEEYYPDKDVYVAVLTNQLSGEDKTGFSDGRFRLFDKIFSLAAGSRPDKEVVLDDAALDKNTGTYAATFKENQTLTIYKDHGKLYMDLSNGTGKHMVMLPLSDTQFLLPDIKQMRTICTFILEEGNVQKLILKQDKEYEWKKIK